jgi:nucleoside permease NupC
LLLSFSFFASFFYVLPSFLGVLSSLFFLLMYISVLDFCVQVYGQLLQGGNQIAVNKYHTVSYRQQQTIICHFTMCLLHVSASTWPSSKGF